MFISFDIPLPNEVSHKTVIKALKGGGGGVDKNENCAA